RGAGLNFLEAGEKIFTCNLQRIEISGCGAVRVEGKCREKAAQRNHAHFLTQGFEISPYESVGMFGNFLQIDARSEWHGAGMDLENLQPRLSIWNSNLNLSIETPGTPKRRIENLGNVRGPDNNDLTARHKTIHQAKQLRDHALFNLTDNFSTFGSDGVDLIDKEDCRG